MDSLSHVWDLFATVVRLVENWSPKKRYSKEIKYRDDLLDFLREEFNKIQTYPYWSSHSKVSVMKEVGRGLCDIAVDKSIGIELKKDLDGKSKVNRGWTSCWLYERI